MLTELKKWTHCRDIDWSIVVDPVKFGDDAVAEENPCWVFVAPPPVACGRKSGEIWENPRFLTFYLMEQ